jgi:hypothetical protein
MTAPVRAELPSSTSSVAIVPPMRALAFYSAEHSLEVGFGLCPDDKFVGKN